MMSSSASDETNEEGMQPPKTGASDKIEFALRELLSQELVDLTRRGRGGSQCWAAALLQTAARQAHAAGAPPHPLADLIARTLDLRHEVSEAFRLDVAEFAQRIVGQTRLLGLGRLHRLRRTVRPFLQEVLQRLGDDPATRQAGGALGRHLTIQQIISRLDPSQPFEIQALAVKSLPDIVNFELHNSLSQTAKRQQTLQSLDQAVGLVPGTKYFKSLTPKMRDACKSQMKGLQQRIAKAERRG